MNQNIRTDLTEDGVLVARIDMPGRTMNVFSVDMMDSLEHLLRRAESDETVRAVVLTSAKQAFLAGADLDMICTFTERARTDSLEQLGALCGRLGRLFRRLERSAKPYVAAINGLALGGGLEVCLACHARLVADRQNLALGLPEIKLGLLPGAGGTQRLPRLIGARLGLEMLLTGEPLTPARALACGLVDEVVAPDNLLAGAMARARALALQPRCAPWDRPGAHFECAPFDFSATDAHARIAAAFDLGEALLSRYPAYHAIMDCVVDGWDLPMDEACNWEMDCFVGLIRDPVAGNLVRTLFLDRQRAAKLSPLELDARVARVAVVGPNGADLERRLGLGKAPLVTASELTDRDVVVVMPTGRPERGIGVAWLAAVSGDAVQAIAACGARVGVWLANSSEHGVALEVFLPFDDAQARDAGVLVARWLRATALLTRGKRLLLPALHAAQAAARAAGCDEDEEALAVSLAAADIWSGGGIDDVALADVAAVLAGLHPSYTGGPFNFLRQHRFSDLAARAALAASRDRELFRLPPCLPTLCTQVSRPEAA
jgi:3-hydroxyacyl-CoA dehydrogenase / enoyl-CoA hydratase / 3-hydroxybutyryl-CoA epimerase